MHITNILGKAQAITGKRGTGKTAKLLELVDKRVKQGDLKYVILTPNQSMAKDLIKRLGNDDWYIYKILSIDDFNAIPIKSGIRDIDIYIDEINLMEIESLYEFSKCFSPISRVVAYTYDDPNPIITSKEEDKKTKFILKVPHVDNMYYALQPDGRVIVTELNYFRNCLYEFTENEIRNHGLDNDYVKKILVVQ